MAKRKITIVLCDLRKTLHHLPRADFKVKAITGSIEYCVGEVLSKEVVETILCYPEWTVKVIEPDKK